MKRLHVTVLRKDLNEKGQKKLEQLGEDYDEPTDSQGRTAEWYREMGIRKLPQELLDNQNPTNMIELDDEDYDFYETDCVINMDRFSMAIDDLESGSTVFLDDGTYVNIIEEVDEVNWQIWWNNRSIWEKIKDYIEIKIINKFKKKKNK